MQAASPFHASVTLPCLNNREIQVDIAQGQNIKDVVYHLMQLHALPPYIATSLYSTILAAIAETSRSNVLYEHKHKQLQKTELRHLFMDAYQSNTLQYNNKPEEDIFPRAYHTLVHCPISTIFDTLLELEQSYAIAIQELQTASDHELVAIQARQAQEIESASSSTSSPSASGSLSNNTDMTTLFTRQVEEMEVFQATWQSDILQTQQTQRQEYREFVIELYGEYQAKLASLSDEQHLKPEDTLAVAEKKLDGKEIVAAAAARVRQWDPKSNTTEATQSMTSGSTHSDTRSGNTHPIITRRRTGSLASSLGSINSTSLQQQQYSPNELATLVRTASLPDSVESAASVKNIQEMGFAKEQAETALVLSNQNMEAAIGLLLENPTKVDAYMAEQKFQQQQMLQQQQFQQMARPPASSSTPYRRSHSLSQVPRPTIVNGIPTSPTPNSASSVHSRQGSVNETSSTNNNNNTNTNSRRHSLQRFSTTPTFLSIMSSGNKGVGSSSNSIASAPPSTHQNSAPTNATNNATNSSNNKSWNPISFLKEQKQAMENTNLSSVRKLGGWLGKAMENLGIENEENDGKRGYGLRQQQRQHQQQHQQNVPQLVESFTIMMGTAQIKSSHNLRLLVTDEANEIFHPPYDPPREMAYRAETATKLYTSHLSAAIVLVDIGELTRRQGGWRYYKTGKGSNKALFERCQQSTEFHFADIETQLGMIEQDFEQQQHPITEGSFFVTKHSNLPSTQVVFHLLVDSSGITNADLSNRHPLIAGLRNISKMTTQFDISSLSIPLLLLPDRFLENPDNYLPGDNHQHMMWLYKRGEAVMKCIKGFLIENSRSGKRVQNEGLDRAESMGGGGMRNVEFLLPSRPDVYAMGLSPSATGDGMSSTAAAHNAGNAATLATSQAAAAAAAAATATAASAAASGTGGSSGGGASHSGSFSGTLPGLDPTSSATPHEVEVAFQQFRGLLVNLFRTS